MRDTYLGTNEDKHGYKRYDYLTILPPLHKEPIYVRKWLMFISGNMSVFAWFGFKMGYDTDQIIMRAYQRGHETEVEGKTT